MSSHVTYTLWVDVLSTPVNGQLPAIVGFAPVNTVKPQPLQDTASLSSSDDKNDNPSEQDLVKS